MAKIAKRLQRALESECADDIWTIIDEGRKEDLADLRKVVEPSSGAASLERTRAIYALGRLGDGKSVATIEKVLPELPKEALATAIDALGRLGEASALKSILAYADDPSPDVRKFATIALGRFDASKAQQKLEDIHANDPVEYLRNLALKYIDRRKRRK